MLKIFKIAAAIILSITTISALAADGDAPTSKDYVVAEIPIYTQKIRFKLPLNWQHANTSQSPNAYLIEFIPVVEKIENWSNLFSVQGLKDFDPAIKPEEVADSIAQKFAQICPDTVIYNKLGARFLSGQEAFMAIIGCSETPTDQIANLKAGMSEISYYAIVKGQRDLYIAHKSIRGVGFTPDKFPPFVQNALNEMTNFLPLEFCSLDSPRGICKTQPSN